VKNTRPAAPPQALIARPTSPIARKAAGRVVVKSGLRAGAASRENAEKRT
jgi:hypothetical protein